MLSLDDVYKGLRQDRETYYFLWVAVRKVLEEAPGVNKYRYFLYQAQVLVPVEVRLSADEDT
jgi:hypothetical protein